MQTNDLTLVNLYVRFDVQPAAILQAIQRIGQCFAFNHRDQNTVVTLCEFSFADRPVVIEYVRHDSTARGQRHEHRPEADKPARRYNKLEPNTAARVLNHILHFSPALSKLFHHTALVLGFAIND